MTKEQIHRLYAQGLANLLTELRDACKKAHKEGGSAKSEDLFNKAVSKYTREFEKEHNVMITDKRIKEKAEFLMKTEQGERLAVYEGDHNWPDSVMNLSNSIDWTDCDAWDMTPSYRLHEKQMAKYLGGREYYKLLEEAGNNTNKGCETKWTYVRDKVGHFAFDSAVKQVILDVQYYYWASNIGSDLIIDPKGITPEKAREELIKIIGEDLFPKFAEKFIMTDKKPRPKDIFDFMVKENA